MNTKLYYKEKMVINSSYKSNVKTNNEIGGEWVNA